MNTSRLFGAAALALGSLTFACGPLEQDSRTLSQSEGGEKRTRPSGPVMDFTITKPMLNRMWGSGDKDIWGAGPDGLMLHWDGKVWRRIAVPTGNNLLAIWGSSDKDVWAVGEGGVVIRYDGTSWSRSTTPVPDTAALNDIWGTSGSNIWAVGDRGVIIQFNGSAWGAFSLPAINNLLTVWAASTTDAWIGGDLGMLLRWDGSSWQEQPSNSTLAYLHIRGTAPNRVYAARKDVDLQFFDGTKWARLSAGIPATRLWMTGDTDVWAFGLSDTYRYNGMMWTSASLYTASALWSNGPSLAWANASTSMVRYNGTSWSTNW